MDEWAEENYGDDYPLLVEDERVDPWFKKDFWRPGR